MTYYFSFQTFIFGIILVSSYVTLFIAERIWPLRKSKTFLLPRVKVNLVFTGLVLFSVCIFIGPLVKYLFHLTTTYKFGLLNLIYFPKWIYFVVGFLILDLTMYYWHRLNHLLGFLWRFHNVHHVDLDLDVTTSMRFHFIEIAYSISIRFIQIIFIGINPALYFLYEFVFQLATFFHHSNIKIPIFIERAINILFVTPRMHGIHHSDYMLETNSNYGTVFSCWDRLHKSIKLNITQKDILIGVPAYHQVQDNTIKALLLMPFKKQRRYWMINNHPHIKRIIATDEKSSFQLSE